MQNPKSLSRCSAAAGFALPSILVVVGALLILAVGILLVVGIERNTARSFSDRTRAELAAKAGLEDVHAILNLETSNDDFMVVQSALSSPIVTGTQAAPSLFVARGEAKGTGYSYRYTPLFSATAMPETTTTLASPPLDSLLDKTTGKSFDFTTLPYQDKVRVAWLPVLNDKKQMVGRYAYWVEDLQGRLDAGTAGNVEDGGAHKRYGWKAGDTSAEAHFPASGLNAKASDLDANSREKQPALNQVALYALDPTAKAKDESDLDKTIIEGRKALVSPGAVLAVAGIAPPLTRDPYGHLVDPKARSVEENLTASVQPYDEQPLVPFANGIAGAVAGKPKLNLNGLLAKPANSAVDEMADWIKRGLPLFDARKGGFPTDKGEDYLKTLAANAIGYAAPGNKPVVKMGSFRGLGINPILSEIVLDINYLGYFTRRGSKVMSYQFVLFGEMVNHTNLPINGSAALSYEVGLNLPPIGPIPAGSRFDDPGVLGDSTQSTHDLMQSDGRYWSKPVPVSLLPGEYKFYTFATVNYTIDIGAGSIGSNFSLTEPLGSAGISTKWNNEEVDRIPAIVRDSTGLTFSSGLKRFFGKAAIPGHSYGPYGTFINNMGDPRIAHYIYGIALGENSFPENISPNRRNIRYKSIYSSDGSTKLKTYGRVVPSEWPDGGHDPQVSTWSSGWTDAREGSASTNGTGPGFDPTTIIASGTVPQPGEAMTYLSDRGRYYSATELGRLYDPIMYVPTFDPASGLNSITLRGDGNPAPDKGIMPGGGLSWPLAQIGNKTSTWFGGGNTLRIGRPEHPLFNQPSKHAPADMPGNHAARLLDLFHAGKSRSNDANLREGPVVRIEGHVNINTASEETLRAMAAGYLAMDPKLSKRTSDSFDGRMAPPVQSLSLSAPSSAKEADIVAAAIIRGRPYATPSELACAADADGKQVFGNPDLYSDKSKIQWSDAAAEEVFGRVYEASTVRSRNFRVWVVGQAVAPTTTTNTNPEVLSEVRKVSTVFADPGERKNTGEIHPAKTKLTILNENNF